MQFKVSYKYLRCFTRFFKLFGNFFTKNTITENLKSSSYPINQRNKSNVQIYQKHLISIDNNNRLSESRISLEWNVRVHESRHPERSNTIRIIMYSYTIPPEEISVEFSIAHRHSAHADLSLLFAGRNKNSHVYRKSAD